MIFLEEVKHIADLARVEFSSQELERLQKELSLILDYIDKLKEVDIKGIEPMSHSALLKNVFRKDEAGEVDAKDGQGLVDSAPDKGNGFIKVKSVFEKQ